MASVMDNAMPMDCVGCATDDASISDCRVACVGQIGFLPTGEMGIVYAPSLLAFSATSELGLDGHSTQPEPPPPKPISVA